MPIDDVQLVKKMIIVAPFQGDNRHISEWGEEPQSPLGDNGFVCGAVDPIKDNACNILNILNIFAGRLDMYSRLLENVQGRKNKKIKFTRTPHARFLILTKAYI